MDITINTDIKELYEYYEKRVIRAEEMNIDESSRFYPSFIEIKKRYNALSMAVIFINEISYDKEPNSYKRKFFCCLKYILTELFVSEAIINDKGVKEYPYVNINIYLQDEETLKIYNKAKSVINMIKNIDFNRKDIIDILKDSISSIIRWVIIVREMKFSVEVKRK